MTEQDHSSVTAKEEGHIRAGMTGTEETASGGTMLEASVVLGHDPGLVTMLMET